MSFLSKALTLDRRWIFLAIGAVVILFLLVPFTMPVGALGDGGFMPIRISRHEKNACVRQPEAGERVGLKTSPFSRAFHTALQTAFGILGGSV
jgi:hypothetical protein